MGFEVEPFSVKHDYEPPWDKASPVLNTCNPGRMIYVTHNLPPQPVQEGVEVIFSYDVKFVVSGEQGRRCPTSLRGCTCLQLCCSVPHAGQRDSVGFTLGYLPADDG